MTKSVVRITTACAFALLASCQLNDHDSAPRAPDLPSDEIEQGPPDPALAAANSGARRPTAGGTDAGTASNDVPSLTDAMIGDASVDAGTTAPGFPPIPLFDAGGLPPGNFGTVGDGAVTDATPLPPGF